ncbi:hypothetical protein COLO4_37986 [Corchorus olitorius]|uniref:Malectin-like domain-containing protein n=1 Tax=Corchorus olitorius TaxID=93759 RepID=A0A1R3FXZ4_9ROSI|nr:hypothetical protein COLO4_37986 [Corchorus olitorius]
MKKRSKTSTTFCLQNPFFPLFPFLLIFVVNVAIPVTGDTQLTPFDPIENITIDCGSSTDIGQANDHRPWTGDGNGKFSPTEQQSNSKLSTAPQPLPSSVDKFPFATARVSHSEFTYSIPLTSGPKFVRFYFYPTSYSGFNDTKAFFSVKAGPFTLLKNFSALLHAKGQPTLIKEFCLNVDESQRINLTFTPSPDILDSYAFINGIEIVSMPPNLYYGSPANKNGIPFVGQSEGSLYPLGNDTALEKLYRVNVGGSQIGSGKDTGMYRYWEEDTAYLAIAEPSVLPVNFSTNLDFTNIPSYSAPREVYTTARTMGQNKAVNENYSLTWEFSVDSGFHYLVRLHFCEFQIEITEQGDRVFEIKLANLSAETLADVIVWSGGNGFPIYKDYVLLIGNKENLKQQTLSIALHPAPSWRTAYSDAILNGLEIFKLSSNSNLAGLNPDPVAINPPGSSSPSQQSKSKTKTLIGIVVGVIAGIIVLSLLGFFIFRRKMRVKDSDSSKGTNLWSQFSTITKSTKSNKSHGSALPSDLCRYFSLAEIKGATNNFDSVFIIGVGGFEYYRRQQLTEKSDVYSFGVVLCEILCARPPISRTVDKAQVSLASWAQQCHKNGTLYKIIDPFLRGKIAPECLKKFTEVAMSCLLDDGTERPSMGDIVWNLEFALELETSGEEGFEANDAIEVDIDDESPLKNMAFEDDSGEVFSSIGDHVLNSTSTTTFSLTTSDEQSFASKDSDRLMSKAVFSQIGDPQGR